MVVARFRVLTMFRVVVMFRVIVMFGIIIMVIFKMVVMVIVFIQSGVRYGQCLGSFSPWIRGGFVSIY